jgi:hypothetical protein
LKTSKSQLIVWTVGLLMPLWLLVADLTIQRFSGTRLSGVWLYVSVIAAAVLCASVIAFSRFAVWQRIALVLASWLLLAGEALALGAFELSKTGLAGTQ